MQQTLESVIAGLVRQLEDQGSHPETISNYRIVCNSIILFCRQHCTDNEILFSSELLDQYLKHTEQCYRDGSVSKGYSRFKKRIVRMLEEYAQMGKADPSVAAGRKKYIPQNGHVALIRQVLDTNKLMKSSRSALEPVMRHFFCFIEGRGLAVSGLTDTVFFEFLDAVAEINAGSMGRTFRALRLISDFLKNQGLTGLDADLSLLKVKSAPVRVIPPYSQSELQRIVDSIDLSTPTGIRNKAILLLAFETGLRSIDIRRLKLSDIDWKKAMLHIVQSKTGSPLALPLSGMVMNAVADYILHTRPDCSRQEIFLTVRTPYRPFKDASTLRGAFEAYCRDARVQKREGRSFHSVRRSFAKELSMAGIPFPTVSQMPGHKNIDQDKPYLSYDKGKNAFCALGFSDVPVTCGRYAALRDRVCGRGRRRGMMDSRSNVWPISRPCRFFAEQPDIPFPLMMQPLFLLFSTAGSTTLT